MAHLQRALMEALACASTGLAGGLIGIDVIQLSSGRTLMQMNQQNQFSPASNAKLYTADNEAAKYRVVFTVTGSPAFDKTMT